MGNRLNERFFVGHFLFALLRVKAVNENLVEAEISHESEVIIR